MKAATPQVIQKGFIRNGMIDKESNLWSCFDGMMQTLRRSYSMEEYNLVLNSLPVLLKNIFEKGFVPENVYDDVLKFPHDKYADGNEYIRDYNESMEWMQRSKILTHTYQKKHQMKKSPCFLKNKK